MVYILGNLIVDFLLYIEEFPVEAQALQGVSHVAIGPGGACNVAIVASRFGLPVTSLGEVGKDYFGEIVLTGLKREGILTGQILVNEKGFTPVAGVLVDPQSEPGYLGYPGEQTLTALPEEWREDLQSGQALFVDGWIEYEAMAGIILEALRVTKESGGKTFFDPGPGNPRQDNAWHCEAAALSDVVLLTESELARLTGEEDSKAGARKLLDNGSALIVVKRGPDGLVIYTADEMVDMPGLPLKAVDATGAGDSLAGSVIYGLLNDLSLEALGTLANATGNAKVLKIGTGHQVPKTAEIRAILDQFDLKVAGWH
ncbi:MAG: carbohydrate kinase family protein [Candidatus Promineifilaceae bacterium]|jgi:ribokinase